jgi:hypothetical protein
LLDFRDQLRKIKGDNMNKKFFSLLAALLVSALITSTASAGGAVKLFGATFRLGSLIAIGTFTGLGGYSQGVTAELVASGFLVVTCTNQNGNQAPGQNPPQISVNGEQIVGPQGITRKGTAPMNVTAEPGPITGTQGGCPNDHWTAQIDFVFWTNAAISVRDTATGALLLQQDYNCTTTRDPDSVSCTAVP